MKPIGFHRAALQESADASLHYTADSPAVGRRFFDHIDRLICEIEAAPWRFRIFDPPARRHFGRPFPYAVLYLNLTDRIWIVAVMHFKQRPGYWRGRLA